MKTTRWFTLGLGIIACAAMFAAAPHAAGADRKDAKTAAAAEVKTGRQVLAGEIIDLDCYLPDPAGGRGPGHAECARHCVGSGKPSALLVGERLYVIIGAGDAIPHEALGAVAGYPVNATGTVMVQNGVPFLLIEKVERVDAAKGTTKG